MSLNTVTTGNTVLAADINQLVNVLQAPSGATETGKYFAQGGTNASGWVVAVWVQSQSRTSVPVSVTFDTSTALVGLSGASTSQLGSTGFLVGAGGTGVSNTARMGGNYTIQY